jgi:AcrR family transcriptional regulator
MRITAQAKAETLERLLDAAQCRLRRSGDLTTRDVARDAGVAHGTLFNYFPTKEALARAVCERELAAAAEAFEAARRPGTALEEELFALVMAGLHRLAPFRKTVGDLFREAPGAHLEPARRLVAQHRGATAASPIALHIYGALYVGLLAWWSADESPKQEATLAVLDRSLAMFTDSLEAPG